VPNARIEREGTQRWLVVDVPPEQAFGVVREFLPTVGLQIEREDAQVGVVETDLLELMAYGSTENVDVFTLVDRFEGPAVLYRVLPGDLEEMTEAVHVAVAIRGGASLVHGLQMLEHVTKSSMGAQESGRGATSD